MCVPLHDGPAGSQILDGVLAWAECQVEERYAGGDHSIIVGRAQSIAIERPDVDPLLYFAGGYRGMCAPVTK